MYPDGKNETQSAGGPKVSVGLPTYNRARALRRAVESVLAQDFRDIELVISDNASTDETESLCREFAARDSRVRYIRQPFNRGLTPNYMATLESARGEYFLWLSDDDWLDTAYVSSCLRALEEGRGYVSVCGTGKYFRAEDGASIFEGEVDLVEETGAGRVLSYLRHVGRNATFYGVVRRAELERTALPNAVGGDWLLVCAVAFAGKVRVLEDVFINRTVGGNSEDFTRLARALSLPRRHVRNPFLTIALSLLRDIGWRSPVYRELPLPGRLKLGAQAFAVVFSKHAWPYTRNHLRGYARLLRHALASPGKVWKRLRTNAR